MYSRVKRLAKEGTVSLSFRRLLEKEKAGAEAVRLMGEKALLIRSLMTCCSLRICETTRISSWARLGESSK